MKSMNTGLWKLAKDLRPQGSSNLASMGLDATFPHITHVLAWLGWT